MLIFDAKYYFLRISILQITLFQLNPLYKIKMDDEKNNENLINDIVEKICDEKEISLIILKIQLYFTKHYHNRGENVFLIFEIIIINNNYIIKYVISISR